MTVPIGVWTTGVIEPIVGWTTAEIGLIVGSTTPASESSADAAARRFSKFTDSRPGYPQGGPGVFRVAGAIHRPGCKSVTVAVTELRTTAGDNKEYGPVARLARPGYFR